MVTRLNKSDDFAVSEHFNAKDFHCKCNREDCDFTLVDSDLIKMLDDLSTMFGPIRINSGYRCKMHNAQIGGEPGSLHCSGQAADIASELVSVDELHHMLDHMLKVNGGLGKYSAHVHLDTREGKARWGK